MSGAQANVMLRFGDMAVGDVGPFNFNWGDWVTAGDMLTATVVTTSAPTELAVIGNPGISGAVVTCWLGGGCANSEYDIFCQVMTLFGRGATRRAKLFVAPALPD